MKEKACGLKKVESDLINRKVSKIVQELTKGYVFVEQKDNKATVLHMALTV